MFTIDGLFTPPEDSEVVFLREQVEKLQSELEKEREHNREKDKQLLETLKANHKLVITLEDGILDGGFGEKISRFYGNSDIKVLNFGGIKEFTDRVPVEELYQRYRLTKELITDDVAKCLNLTSVK